MIIYKKLKLSRTEARRIERNLDDYLWVAIDTRRGSIAAGDEYVATLRDCLLIHRSRPEDIYGVGVDLKTGDIDYVPSINRRNPSLEANGNVPFFQRRRIETLVYYFFETLSVFCVNENTTTQCDSGACNSESSVSTTLNRG